MHDSRINGLGFLVLVFFVSAVACVKGFDDRAFNRLRRSPDQVRLCNGKDMNTVPDNLRNTLLFAAALQVFGPGHELTSQLEASVRQRNWAPIDDQITQLDQDDREQLLARFQVLMCQLPEEVRAA